jgi:hypothetical protein
MAGGIAGGLPGAGPAHLPYRHLVVASCAIRCRDEPGHWLAHTKSRSHEDPSVFSISYYLALLGPGFPRAKTIALIQGGFPGCLGVERKCILSGGGNRITMAVSASLRRGRWLGLAIATGLLMVSAQAVAAQSTRTGPTGGKVAVRRGLTAEDYRVAERRLAELGYWPGRVDGRWDGATRHALMAFQKVEERPRTGRLSLADFDRLMVAGRPRALAAGLPHLEVDLVRQVLFIVDAEGVVRTILPVSSGSGRQFVSQGWARNAVTHPGWYTVEKKAPGWNRSPLGLLYYPVYFMWGTAIHGAPAVPARPDSHGCVRIPIFAARRIHDETAIGTLVIVHRGALPPRPPAIMLPIVESVVDISAR